jgi:hypothetical protein
MHMNHVWAPLFSYQAVHDFENFKTRHQLGGWKERIVLAYSAIPGTIYKEFSHLIEGIGELFYLRVTPACYCFVVSGYVGLQGLGYAISAFPGFIGAQGVSLIEMCRQSEKRWEIYAKLEKLVERLKKEVRGGKREALSYQRCQEIIEHLKAYLEIHGDLPFGFLNAQLIEFRGKHPHLKSEDLSLLSSLEDLAIEWATQIEQRAQLDLKQRSLFTRARATNRRQSRDFLETIFLTLHADFTAADFIPPDPAAFFEYLAQATKEMIGEFQENRSDIEKLAKSFDVSCQLEKFAETCGGDFQAFGSKVIEMLRTEETVILSAGYVASRVGHGTCLRLFLKKDQQGNEWISGKVFNRGEDVDRRLFIDEQDRVRVHSTKELTRVLVEKVENSYWFRTFLDLRNIRAKDGRVFEVGIEDYDLFLKEWPGEVYRLEKGGKKLQYGKTCQFSGLKQAIEEMLPSACYKPFLLSLYEKSLKKYLESVKVNHQNLCILREVTAHLARRAVKALSEDRHLELLERINGTLKKVNEELREFSQRREREVFSSQNRLSEISESEIEPLLFSFRKEDKSLSCSPVPFISFQGTVKSRLESYNDLLTTRSEDHLEICRKALEELPSVTDPIWEKREGREASDLIGKMIERFIEANSQLLSDGQSENSPTYLTPDEGALLFKAEVIRFNLETNRLGNPRVRDFYLSRIKEVLHSDSLILLRPTHPDLLREFSIAVDTLLRDTHHLTKGDHRLYEKVEVRALVDCDRYPHLQYFAHLLQRNKGLKDCVHDELELTRVHDPQSRRGESPFTDLDCLEFIINTREDREETKVMAEVIKIWNLFFVLFGLRSTGKGDLNSFNAIKGAQDRVMVMENYPLVRDKEEPRGSDDSSYQEGRKNLFIETFPGLATKRGKELVPALKRSLPFKGEEKIYENQHLLHFQGLEVDGERLPFYELREFLGITIYQELSIDQILTYFDHYFHHMQTPLFCSLFQALLTETYFQEGKTTSLLRLASEEHPEQLRALIEFLQRRQVQARQDQWKETAGFLFWIEGVVVSYLVRGGEEGARAYPFFEERIRTLFAHEGLEEWRMVFSARLISLVPYFENTQHQASFLSLIHELIKEMPEKKEPYLAETKQLKYGYFSFTQSLQRIEPAKVSLTIQTPSFHGVYTQQKGSVFQQSSSFPHPFITGEEELKYFESENRDAVLMFRNHDKLPAYCLDKSNGVIEKLEEGCKTGLIIGTDLYRSEVGQFFGKIASLSHVFIWKDKTSGQPLRVEYPKMGLTFVFEPDQEESSKGKWMSRSHPGFFLDLADQIPLFHPFSHYLVLRSPSGKRMVYMVEAPFEKSDRRVLTRDDEMTVDRLRGQSLLVYYLDTENKIECSQLEHEGLLYLIYLFLQARDDKQVALFLRFWEKNHLLHTDQTNRLISWFLDSQDRHPQVVAVRLKLLLHWLYDPLYEKKDKEKTRLMHKLLEDRLLYLGQRNNVFPFPLSEEEEGRLAASTQAPKDFLLQLKVAKLVQRANRFIYELSIRERQFPPVSLQEKDLVPPTRIVSSLRPDEKVLQNHFLSYYHIAKMVDQEDPRVKDLRYLTRASAHDPSEPVQAIQTLLESVLDFPHLFPSTEAVIQMAEKRGAQEVVQHLYAQAEQLQRVELIFSALSILYPFLSLIREFGKDYLKEVIVTLLIFKVLPIGPFAGLCQGFYFNLFFRTLLSGLAIPLINWGVQELKSRRALFFTASPSPLITSTVPKTLFSPTVQLISEVGSPLDTVLHIQGDPPCIVEVLKDCSFELEGLEEIKKVFHDEQKVEEPCVKRKQIQFLKGAEFKRKELKAFQKQTEYEIKEERIGRLIEMIQNELSVVGKTASKKRENLEALANQNQAPRLRLEVMGNLIEPLSLKELIVAFGRQDHQRIQKSLPTLKEEELSVFETLIGEYLIAKTRENQLRESLKQLERVEELQKESLKEEGRRKILLEKTVQRLREKREFVASKNPHFLVFEYFTGIMLRKNQIDFLERMTRAKGDPKKLSNLLEEAHTGFGKSKVAIPLWLYLTSRLGRIAMITVPETLLEEMCVHLRQVLGEIFDQGVIPLHFDRTKANRLKYLQYVQKVFEEAEQKEQCIVLSINALHGMAVLKQKEAYFKLAHQESSLEMLEELERIREILANKVSNFVDEASECLYPRYFYNYSVGQKQSIETGYLETTVELYTLLVEDEELQKEFDMDFLFIEKKEQTQNQINHEIYRQKVLPRLIGRVIETFQVPKEHQGAVTRSLQGEYDQGCEAYFKTLSQIRLERFSIFREQLLTCLQQSLSCRWHQRYQLGQNRVVCYAENGKIVPRSQFSSLDLTLNFTIQANLRTPFTLADLDDFIRRLIRESLEKSQEELERGITYRTLIRIVDSLKEEVPPFSKITKEDKTRWLDAINRTHATRLSFIAGYVLPTIGYFPFKIESRAGLLTRRIGHMQGASGTLIENVPSSLILRFDPKTVFRNLLVLWQQAQDAVFEISKLEGKRLVEHIFEQFNAHVIVDIAGIFRDFPSTEAVADAILDATKTRTDPPIQAVGFIDKNGRHLLRERKTRKAILPVHASIDEKEIFMFYSQEAAIGFDIPLYRESHALVTVGRLTRQNFLMQGIGRLRGLGQGMRASFIVIKDDLNMIREEQGLPRDYQMQFKDLFLYVFNLEAKNQGEEAFDAMYNEWVSELEELFWKQERQLPLQDRAPLFKDLEPLFCRRVFSHPIKRLRYVKKAIKAEAAKKWALEKLFETAHRCANASTRVQNLEDIRRLQERLLTEAPSDRLRSCYMQEMDQLGNQGQLCFSEADQDLTQMVVADQNQKESLSQEVSLSFSPKVPEDLDDYSCLTAYQKVSSFYPTSQLFIDERILCTKNFFEIARGDQQFYKRGLKPAHYLLVIQDQKGNTSQIVLLDLHDAKTLYHQMQEDHKKGIIRSEESSYFLINSHRIKLLAKNGRGSFAEDPLEDGDFRKMMRQVRPYTGRMTFDSKDLDELKERKEEAVEFLKTVQDQFITPWPHYEKSIGDLLETLHRDYPI